MDHIEAQLKKIRTKLDDVPAFQKAEVSVPFYLPRPFGHHDGDGFVAKNNPFVGGGGLQPLVGG